MDIFIYFILFCAALIFFYCKGKDDGRKQLEALYILARGRDLFEISQDLSGFSDEDEQDDVEYYEDFQNLEHIKGLLYEIRYIDGTGQRTRRTISLKEVDTNIIHAYCYLRKAARGFRLDRLVNATSLATGEVFEKPEVFYEHLSEENNAIKDLLDGTSDVLVLLVGLARADRRFLDCEKSVIFDCLRLEHGMPEDREEWLLEYIDGLRPDPQSFLESAARIRAKKDSFETFLRYAKLLVEADGKVTPKEKELLSSIESRG